MTKIKSKIEEHIKMICYEICKSAKGVDSIILYGGYGRNEGSLILRENNTLYPYNDYDVLIISDSEICAKQIKNIKRNLLSRIEIRWIDLSQMTIKYLRKMRPSIFNYDLKYGSKVIYGNKYILENIPEINPTKIPFEEANILFKTRLWTFLGSLDEKGFSCEVGGENSRFFRNQMAKAILSIVDICLLQKGSYHFSYKERVKRFKKIFPKKEELCSLCDWALSEKLNPSAPNMSAEEIRILYKKVHSYFIEEMFAVLSKRFKTKIVHMNKIIFLWKYYPVNILKRFLFIFFKKTIKFEKQIMLDIAQLYLVLAFTKSGINQQLLKKAIHVAKRINPQLCTNMNWDQARIQVSKMRTN